MIASWIVKRKLRSSWAMWNRGDIESMLANWADESVFSYPADVSVGGAIVGKKAIREFYQRFMQQFPKRKFVLRNICVGDISLARGKAVAVIEARAELTNKDGKDFKMDYCIVTESRNFKAIRVAEYVNDMATVKRAWGEA